MVIGKVEAFGAGRFAESAHPVDVSATGGLQWYTDLVPTFHTINAGTTNLANMP